jgi:hypothetical protein
MLTSPGRAGRSAAGLARSLCLLWLAGVAMRMMLLVMPPVIPQVHDELRISETQVGLLIGLPLAMLAVAAIRHRRSDRRHRYCRRRLDDCDSRPAAVLKFAGGLAAHCSRHVHDQLHLRDHYSDDLRRAVGSDRQAVDCFRAALLVRRCANRARHDRDQASSGRSGRARHMNFRGDFDTMAATSSGLTACTDWLGPFLSAHWRSRIPR